MTPFKSLYGMLLVGLLAVGCEKENKVTPTEENQPVTVKVNQLARVKQNVTLNVDSISDSRCPANVVCVWYGNANVKFSLKNETETQTGELCIGQCGQQLKSRDAVTLQLGNESYEVSLTDVQPFPGTQPDGTPKEAVITVNQKN
jgi:uracil-DNA glycosylase